MNNINNIPEVGKTYKFFDDGKIKPTRMYDVEIIEIIPFWKILFAKTIPGFKVFKAWREELKFCDWLYSKKTDYFIIGKSDEYDKLPLVFVRDHNNDWFSIDWAKPWMSGRLDIDNTLYDSMLEYFEIYDDGNWRLKPW